VLVATPIGNLGDLSPRAVEALATAELICCEDTRRTGRLLLAAGIDGPALRRVDAHTETEAAADVVARVLAGATVAVVTDAGTPGVSDPGARLVRAVLDAGGEVTTVPGPVAAVAAVVASGLDTSRFTVDGFLPRKGPERAARLAELAVERRTVALYEAPDRVAATLADLAAACGDEREAVVARELTKLHEEHRRGSLAALAAGAAADPPRGEVVIVVGGAPAAGAGGDDDVRIALRAARDRGLGPGRAAAEVAAALGRSRREVYALALADGDEPGADEADGGDPDGDDPDGTADASAGTATDADATSDQHAGGTR